MKKLLIMGMTALAFAGWIAYAETPVYDLVIYGSSPAALSAAVQAKRMGASCVIVSPETRIGGLTTGGLGQTDIGNKQAFGGLSLRFYQDVADWYRDETHWTRQKRGDYLPDGQCSGTKGSDSMWTFEPSAALAILEGWEKREELEIHRGRRLDRSVGKVKVQGQGQQRKIISFVTEDGTEYRGRMFVDATYEGDLMAAAGVSYVVGRESNATYGETLNGIQTAQAKHHQFMEGVSPYVKPDDPASGLLPNVEPFDAKEKDGDGDRRMQAYCFRMCLTDDPENRIPFAKPTDYDERNYELLFRAFAAKPKDAFEGDITWKLMPWINSKMPNRKTDTNNRDAFSTDFIGRNWNWPEASYEERERIRREHLAYQRGLMWTLANHPRVPKIVRDEVSKWGTCRDEFADGLGDGWQGQLYVREGRRLVGDYVMTEHNCVKRRLAPRPVAMAAYTMDSHNVRRRVGADGFVHNEGDVQVRCGAGPYGIDYGAIVPKRGECANLFVPVCLSASHIAFGSIRMEPVFFALGQAAGTAAAQAIAADCAVQDLPYGPLAARLLADGQVIQSAQLEPIVPYSWKRGQVERMTRELKEIHATSGLNRFFIAGPGFKGVMYRPFAADLYAEMGREIGAVRAALEPLGIEVGWWCSPSIRYWSDFSPIEDAWGGKSADNKKCPLDPAFQADWSSKVKDAVAAARPRMINIEDDYTLSWGRGLKGGACFCPRHLKLFEKIYGQPLTGPEIAAAFENRTPENLPIRRAFAAAVRESLCELARKVRAAVDEVDPSVRICLCEPGSIDKDGDALEAVARAFAGPRTRPAIRPCGAIYGAQTTPADIPPAVAHTMFTLERIPRDVEMFYEADPYPHNRFFASASQMISLMSGAVFMGSQSIQLYCLQGLDDPLEDPGYADAFLAYRPRLDAVRRFLTKERVRLAGVRVAWQADDLALTRSEGNGHSFEILRSGAFLLSKFGIPYTTRADAQGPAVLAGGVTETMSDDEIRSLLAGGVLVDAPAADALVKRGFGADLGVDVTLAEGRLPVVREEIQPAAGLTRKGRDVNAFYIFCAGTEGTVHTFATLKPHAGTETWSVFSGVDGKPVTPSLTFATNARGGRVAVLATSLLGNRSSGLYNLRKQELFQNLFRRMDSEALPVTALDAPGIWTLAQVSADGRTMVVMANNLSGDVRDNLSFAVATPWIGATVSRLGEDGREQPLGTLPAIWRPSMTFDQMTPEFFVMRK